MPLKALKKSTGNVKSTLKHVMGFIYCKIEKGYNIFEEKQHSANLLHCPFVAAGSLKVENDN